MMGKGACTKRMGPGRSYSTNTIMEKKQTEEGVRIWNFQGVLKKEQVDFPGVN